MRRAAKVDANHQEIVQTLRSVGATVHSLAAVGHGCPDLLVGWNGKTILMELKDGGKAPSARKLTEEQIKWHSDWTGGPLLVVDSSESALFVLKAIV